MLTYIGFQKLLVFAEAQLGLAWLAGPVLGALNFWVGGVLGEPWAHSTLGWVGSRASRGPGRAPEPLNFGVGGVLGEPRAH